MLGCDVDLLHEPGAHLVPGGGDLDGYEGVFLAQVTEAVLVVCPSRLRPMAEEVLAEAPAGSVFSAATCAAIAGAREHEVRGPARHAFVDREHLTVPQVGRGRRLPFDDPLLGELAEVTGEADWSEAGFVLRDDEDVPVVYGIEEDGRLLAAGNLTAYRGQPADIGLVTRPEARRRGLATSLAVTMVTDVISRVEVVRYRARTTNLASLRVAAALGFRERGHNLAVRV